MRRASGLSVTVWLLVSVLVAPATQAAAEISPACGIYQPNHILVDGFVNKPGISLTVDRLAAMPVRIRYLNATAPDAWRVDWPAVSPRGERANSEAQPRALNQAS